MRLGLEVVLEYYAQSQPTRALLVVRRATFAKMTGKACNVVSVLRRAGELEADVLIQNGSSLGELPMLLVF